MKREWTAEIPPWTATLAVGFIRRCPTFKAQGLNSLVRSFTFELSNRSPLTLFSYTHSLSARIFSLYIRRSLLSSPLWFQIADGICVCESAGSLSPSAFFPYPMLMIASALPSVRNYTSFSSFIYFLGEFWGKFAVFVFSWSLFCSCVVQLVICFIISR